MRRACRPLRPADGMHDEAGRLVDDEQVLVLAQTIGSASSTGSSAVRLRAARRRPPPRLSSRWLFGRARAVDGTAPAATQPLGQRARPDLRTLGEDAVEPPPGVGRQERESGSVPTRGLVRSAATNERKSSADADDDERVGEVERGPVVEVEEVGDVTEPERGRAGSRRSRRARARARRAAAGGAAPSGRRRRRSAPIATAVSAITIDVASGTARTRCRCCGRGGSRTAPRPRRRRRARARAETSAFVSWSAHGRGAGDERERRATARRPAASVRCARQDRLQRVRRRADADVELRRGALGPRGLAHPRSSSRLHVDAEHRVRAPPRAAPRGSAARSGARPVRAVVDAGERDVDLADDLLGVLLERLVQLAVEHLARVVGEVLVAGGARELAVVRRRPSTMSVRGARGRARAARAAPSRRASRSTLIVPSSRRPRAGAPPRRASAGRSRRPCRAAACAGDDADVRRRHAERVGEEADDRRRSRGRAPAARSTRTFQASP